jgi:transposase-like protein/IS1 family transposase
MTPHPWFYQLLLAALVLICLIVHVWWPDPRRPTSQRPLEPAKPRRKCSKESQPFAGYIHKPLCEACEHGTDTRPKAPGSPPPVISFTRGRKRTVDTHSHFCPDPDCSYHGRLGLGNIRSNGHPGGQSWRQLQCVSCHGYFYETHGTIFHGKRSSPELIVHVIACLAEGLGIRGTARVFEIDPNTVLQWLVEAAEQLQAFSAYFLHDLHLNQVQLDELYATLSAVRDGDMGEDEAIDYLSTSPRWVWTAIDPESKLMLSALVGERSQAMAQAVLHQIAELLAPGCVPLFLSDGNPSYLPAIVRHFGHWVQPPRRHAKGSAPKPRWMPLPGLLYAQVVKKMRRRRIVEIKRHVVIGTQAAVEQVLKACGWVINTAFVERLNLSLRQRVAPIRRRSATSCKGEAGLDSQLSLFQVYYNFVLPHASLRQALAEPMATNSNGSAKLWQPRTPAMAAGLTDHRWSLREVLMFRVPTWPQPQAV